MPMRNDMSLQQGGDRLDKRHAIYRLAVTDNTDLERAGHIADKGDLAQATAGRHKRRRNGEKSVARPYRIENRVGECRNDRDGLAACPGERALRRLSDDEIGTIDDV